MQAYKPNYGKLEYLSIYYYSKNDTDVSKFDSSIDNKLLHWKIE